MEYCVKIEIDPANIYLPIPGFVPWNAVKKRADCLSLTRDVFYKGEFFGGEVSITKTSGKIPRIDVEDTEDEDEKEDAEKEDEDTEDTEEDTFDSCCLEYDDHWDCYCKETNVCGCGCDPLHDGW